MSLYRYIVHQFNSDISVNNANTEFISTNHINISGGVINVFGPSTHTDNIYLSTDNTFSIAMKDLNTSYIGYGTSGGNANINMDANGNTNIDGSGKFYINTTGGMNITGGFTSLMYITTKTFSIIPRITTSLNFGNLILSDKIRFIGKISNGGLLQLYIIDSGIGNTSRNKYGIGSYVNICCNAINTSQPSLQFYGMSRESGSAIYSQYKFYYYTDTLSNTWIWFTDYSTNADLGNVYMTYTIRIYSNNPSNFYPYDTDDSLYLTSAKEITNGTYTLDNRFGINKTTPAVGIALDVSGSAYINRNTTIGNGFRVKYASDTLQGLNVDPTSGILNVNNQLKLESGIQVNYNKNGTTTKVFDVNDLTGNTNINSDIVSITGNKYTAINNVTYIYQTQTNNNELYVNGNSSVNGNSTFNGNSTISNNLTVSGNSTLSGNVGIGTTPSTYKLDVAGNAHINNELYLGQSNSGSTIYMGGGAEGDNGFDHSAIETRRYANSESTELLLFKGNDGDDRIRLKGGYIAFDINTYNPDGLNRTIENIQMVLNSTGLGIGTTGPDSKLHVNGRVRFSGLDSGISSQQLYIDDYGLIIRGGLIKGQQGDQGIQGVKGVIGDRGYVPYYQNLYAANNFLGIGTSNPSYPLQIQGYVSNGFNIYTYSYSKRFSSFNIFGIEFNVYYEYWYTVRSDTGNPITSINRVSKNYPPDEYSNDYQGYQWKYTSYLMSLYISTALAYNGTANFFSDKRIKTNIVDIDDGKALTIFRKIQPKTYDYVDKVNRGFDNVIGFIAQEIKEIIPNAVIIVKDYIPNFYTLCTTTVTTENSNILQVTTKIDLSWNPLHDFSGNPYIDASGNACSDASGNKCFNIKLQDQKKNEIICKTINVLDKRTFLIDISGTTLIKNEEYFLYGQEVDDFHSIDKNAIFTVVTSAVQDIDRHQQEDAVNISVLEKSIVSLESKNAKLKNTIVTLESSITTLETKVSTLKMQCQKNTTKISELENQYDLLQNLLLQFSSLQQQNILLQNEISELKTQMNLIISKYSL